MKTLTELSRTATKYDQTIAAQDFIKVAIAVGCSRRMSDPIRTRVRAMSPRLDKILGDVNDCYQMTPQQIVDFQKAAVGAGTTSC
jgi:hypothetical protein